MADTQYWREMDKAAHYPSEQKAAAEAKALKSLKVRERKVKITGRKAKAKETVEKRKAKKKPTKKKIKKVHKTTQKKIKKARSATQAFKNIFG